MDAAEFVCSAILPCIVWGALLFVLSSNQKIAVKLRSSWNATTKQEVVNASRLWTVQSLATFSIVLASVLLWSWLQRSSTPTEILRNPHWVSGIFDGSILGLAIIGLAIVLRLFFFEAQKFTLVMLIGAGSSWPTCAAALLLIAFVEEFWRAVSLRGLMESGLSGPAALLAVSIAYGLAYLAWGTTTAISAFVFGAALGGLFIWTSSLYVALAAHVVFLAQVVVYVLVAAPEAGPADIHRRHFFKCPACGATLTLQQIDLDPDEAFFCAYCHARLTVADWRRRLFRRGYALYGVYAMLLAFASENIADRRVADYTVQVLLTFGIALPAMLGLWSWLQVLFPTKLQVETGDPQFIALNLGAKGTAYDQKHSEGTSNPNPRSREP